MKTPRLVLTLLPLLLLTAVGGGCGESQPSRFYSLSPVAQSPAPTGAPTATSGQPIGVGPVELPKYLDRLTIVSFATPNRVDISEYDRWAEPLTDNFTRVLAENLSLMLDTNRVDTYPFTSNVPRSFERQILVDVSQFRRVPDNKVELRAAWRVVDPARRRNLASGSFSSVEPIADQGFEAVVAAMSRAVGALSRDIAARMRELAAGS